MIRLEALRLIRNGPTHPAMMRMTEESEQKKEFPSWMRLTSGLEEQDFLPYVELSLYYITGMHGKFLVDLDMFHGAKSLLI